MPELKIGFVPNDNNANYIKELLVKNLISGNSLHPAWK